MHEIDQVSSRTSGNQHPIENVTNIDISDIRQNVRTFVTALYSKSTITTQLLKNLTENIFSLTSKLFKQFLSDNCTEERLLIYEEFWTKILSKGEGWIQFQEGARISNWLQGTIQNYYWFRN